MDLRASGSMSYQDILAYAQLMKLNPTELAVKIHAIGDALNEDRGTTGPDPG